MTESHELIPNRKVYYIDVGDLPKEKVEAYLKEMMEKHRDRLAK
jgi:hypothetical protein